MNAQVTAALIIGILNWQPTPYAAEAIDGFTKAIDASQVPHTFQVVQVGGDPVKAAEALQQWKQNKVNLVFAIGTEAALAAVRELPDTPVLFISAHDPELTGTDGGPSRPHPNAPGWCTRVDMAVRLRLFREGIPKLKVLGVAYDPSSISAMDEVSDARKTATDLGLILREKEIAKAADIAPAVTDLIRDGGIDALWVPTDPLVYKNLAEVARVTGPAKLPVVTSAAEGIDPVGEEPVALLAVAAYYGELGRLSAQTALDILTTGKKPAEIPVRHVAPHVIVVSADVAKRLGYTIPPAFLAKSHKVLRGYEGQTLTIAGTGDSQDLMRALAKVLAEKVEGATIDVPDSIGSTGGIRALLAGKTDLARIARDLKDEEARAGLTAVIFARAPIAFVVHPSVTGIENVSAADVVGIYSGTVTKWEQLNAREGRIYAVTREPGDACLTVLHEKLAGFADIADPKAKVLYTTIEARDALVGHRNTFGFLAMSVASKTNLQILSVDGVTPTADSVRSGAYGLVLPLSVVYKTPPTGLAKRFVDFLFSEEARRIITEAGAVPMDRPKD